MRNINVVLVNTTHPGNIGASARAMKTMGLEHLRLVNPAGFPGAEVTARAAGASEILAAASVHDSLKAAIRDCGLVIGTSARTRSVSWPEYTPREAAAQVLEAAGRGTRVAVVFGREKSGLSNEELALCSAMVRIPASHGFQSLNLAAAVQVIAYELHVGAASANAGAAPRDARPASAAEMELFYDHLEQCLVDLGFMDPEKPRRLMLRLRRLFNRAHPDENEYNILRGILAAIQARTGGRGE